MINTNKRLSVNNVSITAIWHSIHSLRMYVGATKDAQLQIKLYECQ